MIPLPIGITLLAIVTIAVYLGLAERVIDRMKLDHRTALLLLGFLIISHFLPEIQLTSYLAINLGALVPLGIVVYLLSTTSPGERNRALIASFGTALLLWLTDRLLPLEPGGFLLDIDPLYIGGIIAGVIAYLLGRSRRSAFIGAVLGVLLLDIVALFYVSIRGLPQTVIIGGGGMFDAIIIASLIAVGIAEFVGEINERIHRGPAKVDDQDGDDLV